jgi:hypothetical protein
VAYLDEPSVLPCAGNDAFGPDAVGDLALALEGSVLDSDRLPCVVPAACLNVVACTSVLLVSLSPAHQPFAEMC